VRRVGLTQLTNKYTQAILATHVAQGVIVGALVTETGAIVAFGPEAELKDERAAIAAHPTAVKLWSTAAPQVPVRRHSRTQTALELMRQDTRLSPHAAAKKAGVHVSAVYRQLERNAQRGCCAACGQLLPVKHG
jgi:hypothetical protein